MGDLGGGGEEREEVKRKNEKERGALDKNKALL